MYTRVLQIVATALKCYTNPSVGAPPSLHTCEYIQINLTGIS